MRRFYAFIAILLLLLFMSACSAMREISTDDTVISGAESPLSASKQSDTSASKKTEAPAKNNDTITPKEIIPTDAPVVVAKRFVENLVRGDIAKAREDCASSIDFDGIVTTYDQLSSSLGRFIEAVNANETTQTSSGASIPVVTITAAFDEESLLFSIEFSSGKISQVWMDRSGGY